MMARESRGSQKEDPALRFGKDRDDRGFRRVDASPLNERDAESTVVGICDLILGRLETFGADKAVASAKRSGARERTRSQVE